MEDIELNPLLFQDCGNCRACVEGNIEEMCDDMKPHTVGDSDPGKYVWSKLSPEKFATFRVKQQLPYHIKVKYAAIRAREFIQQCGARGLSTHVSVGGLDSITLFCFLQSIGLDVPGISCSYLEDISIQRVHHRLGIERIHPISDPGGGIWNQRRVLQEFGFPILSKEKANKLEMLMNPTPKNALMRRTKMTGTIGNAADGTLRFSPNAKMPEKWLKLFAGANNAEYGTDYKIPPFKVSDKCCYFLKEKPLQLYAKENHSVPFMGLMAVEGGRREKALIANGCNYFSEHDRSTRSCPFAIFTRQDLLQLALDLNVPVPEIYGTIEADENGKLYTTGAERTGCMMCGFGIHLEKRPHRFDMLREQNPKAWKFWMYECCTDEKTGEKYGWGRVLDYIGVQWEEPFLIK